MSGRRGLIVDDHAPARTVLRNLLGHFGLECMEAASGAAALDLLLQTEADYAYVFIDWMMPGMSGEELIEAIHDLPLARRPEIVVVSAHDLERIHERCDRQGLCHFLPKPVLPRDVRVLFATGPREKPAEMADESPEAPARLQDLRVLLVEDNLINQQIASEMLRYHGARVDVAGNGQEALDLLIAMNDNPYQVVLMDIQMPVMDGYETTRRLRAEPRFARLPIIAMTAHAMIEERERCLAAGMNAHVAKPFTMDDLVETLSPYANWPTTAPIPRADTLSTIGETVRPRYPGLDLDQGLVHCGGNRELFDRIIAGYDQDFAGLADALEGCLAKGQWEELAVLAHSFKGLSGTIGAVELQTLAGEIEQAGAAQAAEMPLLIARLRRLLATTLASVRQLQPEPAQPTAPPPVIEAAGSPQEILAELRHLLTESDSAVQDLWKKHEQALRAILPPALGKQMALAIARFQFEEALNLLSQHQDNTHERAI